MCTFKRNPVTVFYVRLDVPGRCRQGTVWLGFPPTMASQLCRPWGGQVPGGTGTNEHLAMLGSVAPSPRSELGVSCPETLWQAWRLCGSQLDTFPYPTPTHDSCLQTWNFYKLLPSLEFLQMIWEMKTIQILLNGSRSILTVLYF